MVVLLALITMALVGIISTYLPPGIDWHGVFRPAARELLHARDPYQIEGYFYPTWALLPMLPIAILPEDVGRAIFLLISLASLAFAAHRLGARPLALAAFLASPPVMHGLLNANIDWMPLLGFVFPPQLGLFLIVIKPQIGFTVGIFWLIESWRKGGLLEVVRVFLPVTLGLLASFLIFGLWPVRFERTLAFWWNASLWPMSIPVGLALLATAIRKHRLEYAMGAAPCLSPYVLFHSWSGALLAIVASSAETVAAVIGLWVLVIIRSIA